MIEMIDVEKEGGLPGVGQVCKGVNWVQSIVGGGENNEDRGIPYMSQMWRRECECSQSMKRGR